MTMTLRAQSRCVLRTTECWDKLRDLSLAKHYVPGVTDIEFVSQNRTGLGASRIAHSKLATLHETVVEWHEGRGVGPWSTTPALRSRPILAPWSPSSKPRV